MIFTIKTHRKKTPKKQKQKKKTQGEHPLSVLIL